jgi:Glycosyltransferase like family
MFSVIICSIRPDYLEQLKINLSRTIGEPYELLVWDNRAEPRGLCEVYNRLASGARYPFLCFIHEDILFESENWGGSLLRAFGQDPALGLIGVAGATYKSRTPSGWSTGLPEYDRVDIRHRDPSGQTIHLYQNPSGAGIEPVVTADGVFLCTPKEIWGAHRFDESRLKGFHGYDLDFSFRIGRKHRIGVLFGIGILHLTTGGNFGDEWVTTILGWHRRNALSLPASFGQSGRKDTPESRIRKKCLHRLRTEKISFRNKISWLLDCGALSDPGSWPYVWIFLFPRAYGALRKKGGR